ncbi:hypothetical protein Tco_0996506 [Tanacetum coccineum]
MPLIERQLVRNLQHISEVLYAQVVEDHWEKHKEAATSYADLRANVESYYEENVDHKDQTMMCRLEVGSIRRIQGLDTTYWGFLRVGTTLDIFQNIHILFLRYGVLRSPGYGVLGFISLWSLVSASTDTPYLPL